jgi:hypothetical protein
MPSSVLIYSKYLSRLQCVLTLSAALMISIGEDGPNKRSNDCEKLHAEHISVAEDVLGGDEEEDVV